VLRHRRENVDGELIDVWVIDPDSMNVAMNARLRDWRSSLAMTSLAFRFLQTASGTRAFIRRSAPRFCTARPSMHRTVAALASALAKAQAELINPEKSLTATIRTGRPGDGERSFRYAPLSSGLDIVRKTLGQHEIATLQTTAIDQTAGMVNLTTTLAHASGEWIASDWPVCPLAETANPQRMGAALTYARRYALFTLVGIAGEDDLDAPALCDGLRSPTPSADECSLKPRDGQPRLPPPKPGNGQRHHRMHGERPSTLEPEQSAALRDKLLTALGNITSADGATIWAQEALAAKIVSRRPTPSL
jgi:hypothetical protein